MAITFVCNNKENEQVVNNIKASLSADKKKKRIKIYIIETVEELEKLPKEFNNNQIIITENVSSEFVSEALNKTHNIIYNSFDDSLIKKVIEKIG